MKIVNLDPKEIQWPENRVTAYYQEGQEEMLKESLEVMGQQQPIVVVSTKDGTFGVDGLHRCLAAIQRGDKTVPCVVTVGEAKDVQMKNLVLNSLRGRTKASEQASVIGELFDKLGVTIDELELKTGHSRDWVEKLIVVSRAGTAVRQALDDELLSLSHAFLLAKVADLDVQERLCMQQLTYRWSAKQLEENIKGTMNIVTPPTVAPSQTVQTAVAELRCGICRHPESNQQITILPVCVSCHGMMVDQIRLAASGKGPGGGS